MRNNLEFSAAFFRRFFLFVAAILNLFFPVAVASIHLSFFIFVVFNANDLNNLSDTLKNRQQVKRIDSDK